MQEFCCGWKLTKLKPFRSRATSVMKSAFARKGKNFKVDFLFSEKHRLKTCILVYNL